MMLKTRNDIVRTAISEQKLHRAVERRMQRRLKTLITNYRKRISSYLKEPGVLLKENRMEVQAAIKIVDDLQSILGESGADDLIADYIESFDPIAEKAAAYFGQLGESETLVGVSKEALTGYVRYSEEYLRQNLDAKLVKPVADSIFQIAYGGFSKAQAISDLENAIERIGDTGQLSAELIINDSLQQFQRAVTVERADSLDLEIYVYAGPLDEITSDQCAHMLTLNEHGMEGALYKDEISEDLHEDLRANPLIAGGHPRCRHKFYPISLDFAISEGFEPRKGKK